MLRVIDAGWTSAQKEQVIDWFAKASKWRGGSTFAGHVNNIFDATIDSFSEDEKQVAYKAAPLFAPITEETAAALAAPRILQLAVPPVAEAGAAAAVRACRSIGRSATTTWCSRAAAARLLAGRGGAQSNRRRARVPRDLRPVPPLRHARQGLRARSHQGGGSPAGRDILRSIFFPSEKVDPKFSTTVIATKDGATIRAARQRKCAERRAEDRRRAGAGDGGEDADCETHHRAVDHARGHRGSGHGQRGARRRLM